MSRPVTVVVPTIESRRKFLLETCLPAIWANDPAEVLVFGDDRMNANEKRNAGGYASTQPFLLFVDDDTEIAPDCLSTMLAAIELTGAAIAYCNYRFTVLKEDGRNLPAHEIQSGKWNVERLRTGNYIDTASLIRRANFPGFDPAIRRFQDWDLWLTMAARGCVGTYIPRCLVNSFVIDRGISATVPGDEAMKIIMRKHGL